MAKRTDDNIIWIDMEMTGLDPEKCHILEIACLITDGNLNSVSSMFHVVVNQPPEILASMNDWCKKHHSESGLIEASKNSDISINEAEDQLLTFLKRNSPKGGCPLAGNSIYMDKLFIIKYLPKVNEHLHYRLIDVTTIFELCKRLPLLSHLVKVLHHEGQLRSATWSGAGVPPLPVPDERMFVFELRRWYPNFRSVKKTLNHRAKTDVQESILELKFLRKTVFQRCFQ